MRIGGVRHIGMRPTVSSMHTKFPRVGLSTLFKAHDRALMTDPEPDQNDGELFEHSLGLGVAMQVCVA